MDHKASWAEIDGSAIAAGMQTVREQLDLAFSLPKPVLRILTEFVKGFFFHIDHVPTGVIGKRQMIFQVVIQEYMAEGILSGVEWSSSIIVSAQNPDLQEGVLGDTVTNHLLLSKVTALVANRERPCFIDIRI